MLSFAQFLQLQQKFVGGPSGARPMNNIPMGERGYATPQTVYQHAIQGMVGERERMQFTDDKGQPWDCQWVYAVPTKPSSTSSF